MKIISKYKDYYDYLAGVYGVDDLLILDRRSGTGYTVTGIRNIELVVCGVYIRIITDGSVNYESAEAAYAARVNGAIYRYNYFRDPIVIDLTTEYERAKIELGYNRPNEIIALSKKYPIFIYEYSESIPFPMLKPLGIAKIIPAEKIWLMLSQWLSDRITEGEKPVPIGSDKTRILSAGFDLKTSFRGK